MSLEPDRTLNSAEHWPKCSLKNSRLTGSFRGHHHTVLANIKSRAAQLPEALNGSMRFDRESLEPLFKLDIGTPGSSFTFEVASINGIDNDLISRAKGKLDGRKVRLDELIGELQKEKNTLSKITDRNLRKELENDQLRFQTRVESGAFG